MEKIIYKIIDEIVKGADTYTHNGSTWLIFTDTKQWAIELTRDKTLWYNYNFFKNAFVYASMDVVENQHYITKWVEENVIGVVKETKYNQTLQRMKFKDVLENGVKETIDLWMDDEEVADNIIETGVKNTELHKGIRPNAVGETIQYGVKETIDLWMDDEEVADNIIENGVKETRLEQNITEGEVEEIIEFGIKKTKEMDEWVNTPRIVGEVIDYGVKETISINLEQFGIGYTLWKTQTVIEQGIKEVQPLPSQEGNKDWGIYYHKKGNRIKPHTEYVDETIKEGIKI